MPSGPKKRKAAKRKMMTVDLHPDGSPMNPNPESEFLSPMLPPAPQGNGRDRRLALIEDEETVETFETPRFQPVTPRLTDTPYFSMENVKSARRGEIDRLSEVTTLIGDKFKGLDVETTPKDRESSKAGKLEESVAAVAKTPDGSSSKEVKLDESVAVADEESSGGDEEESVDVSSSNEKEVKVVPWTDDARHVDFMVEDDDVDAIHQGKGPFVAFRKGIAEEMKRERAMFSDNRYVDDDVDVDGVHYDGKGFTDSERITEKESLLYKGREEVDDVIESAPKMLPQIDSDSTNNKLEKFLEKSPVPIEDFEDAKTETAQGNEVAEGPIVARRATLWNCCGFLEVFTSRDR